MHKLWDDGCGFFDQWEEGEKLRRPLAETGLSTMTEMATAITTAYPESTLNYISQLDPKYWAMESHDLAIKYGYRGAQFVDRGGRDRWIRPDDAPSGYYMEKGKEVVEKQLAIAGYRLAQILNEIHAGL